MTTTKTSVADEKMTISVIVHLEGCASKQKKQEVQGLLRQIHLQCIACHNSKGSMFWRFIASKNMSTESYDALSIYRKAPLQMLLHKVLK